MAELLRGQYRVVGIGDRRQAFYRYVYSRSAKYYRRPQISVCSILHTPGRVQAINLETKKTGWATRQRAPQSSGMLATAGGIVFAGALDRVFAAYDDASGRELWRVRLNDVPNSEPISYQVNGKQYIAVVTGNGGPQSATFPALAPEIQNPPDREASIWVFELPDRLVRR